ncbi:hypothetical protein M2436_006474 [Streptomyces sp. HB372]|nr:hypothetical protein [Streptomyces sp. HB372]
MLAGLDEGARDELGSRLGELLVQLEGRLGAARR